MRDPATLRRLAENLRKLAVNADSATAAEMLEIASAYEAEALGQEPDAEPPLPAS